MRFAPLLISLVLSATSASGLTMPQSSAAQAVQEVIYMEVQPTQVENALQGLRSRLRQLRQVRSDLDLLLLQELGRPYQFVLLAASREGKSVSLADLSESRQHKLSDFQILPDFNLDSIYLNGEKRLDIPLGALTMVAHLDSDPSQREKTLAQLQILGTLIPKLKGTQGSQILTWKKRTNHWTLVTTWKDLSSYYGALEDPNVKRIRATIASHAAAPSDLRLYRRVE